MKIGSITHSGGYAANAKKSGNGDFIKELKDFLSKVNKAQLDADMKIKEFAAGKRDITEVMMALTKADISLRLLLQVRNKAMEAFQEIMRTQV